jgi:hypothetical protein
LLELASAGEWGVWSILGLPGLRETARASHATSPSRDYLAWSKELGIPLPQSCPLARIVTNSNEAPKSDVPIGRS